MGRVLLGLIAAAAIFLPTLLFPEETTPLRWLYLVLAQLLALAMLLNAIPLARTAFGRIPRTPPAAPRHARTAELPVIHRTHNQQHFTLRMPTARLYTQTAPIPQWPEKTLIKYKPEKRLLRPLHVAISQPGSLPTALAHSPSTVLVSLEHPNTLLTYRRELTLAGTGARFFRSLAELSALLPISPQRDVSTFLLCGDFLFLADVRELLLATGIPPRAISVEAYTPAPTLPEEHPSAPVQPQRARHRAEA
jgi:hypothetical protein